MSDAFGTFNVIPGNKTLLLADSRYRDKNDKRNSVYNFFCDLSGQGIYAKEIYYQKLVWSQPLFSHNNSNCELLFQVNYDQAHTYVVYVTPFVMFGSFDGNEQYGPINSPLGVPQPYSYAYNMEMAFNYDVRRVDRNQLLVNNGTGRVPVDPDNPDPNDYITFCFRYCSSKGFCLYPVQNSVEGKIYTIKLLDCSYIRYAHFVHGFGVYNSAGYYKPNNYFSVSIWSDCVPTLLPFRYVTVKSPELTKDRKLLSFTNTPNSEFVSELAVLHISFENTGVFGEIAAGEDSTVITTNDNYTPQSFRIQILDDLGEVLQEGDPISLMFGTSGLDSSSLISFYSGVLRGRGNPQFMNYLLFGSKALSPLDAGPDLLSVLSYGSGPPSMREASIISRSTPTLPYISGPHNPIAFLNDVKNDLVSFPPHIVLLNVVESSFNANANISSGFANDILLAQVMDSHNLSIFRWYPYVNPQPAIYLQYYWNFVNYSYQGIDGSCYELWLVMFDVESQQYIMGRPLSSYVGLQPPIPPTITQTNLVGPVKWILNPEYIPTGIGVNDFISVGFGLLALDNFQSGNHVTTSQMYDNNPSPPSQYKVKFVNPTVNNLRYTYTPTQIEEAKYPFGNPLADGMDGEVIHEIGVVLDYN